MIIILITFTDTIFTIIFKNFLPPITKPPAAMDGGGRGTNAFYNIFIYGTMA
jgi:hypothetical protein